MPSNNHLFPFWTNVHCNTSARGIKLKDTVGYAKSSYYNGKAILKIEVSRSLIYYWGHLNQIKTQHKHEPSTWPCSPSFLVAQWLEHPLGVGEVNHGFASHQELRFVCPWGSWHDEYFSFQIGIAHQSTQCQSKVVTVFSAHNYNFTLGINLLYLTGCIIITNYLYIEDFFAENLIFLARHALEL